MLPICPNCGGPVSPDEDRITDASEEHPEPSRVYHAACTDYLTLSTL